MNLFSLIIFKIKKIISRTDFNRGRIDSSMKFSNNR